MKRIIFAMVIAMLGLWAMEPTAAATPAAQTAVSLVPYASGFNQPLAAVSTGVTGDERLFVLEKEGKIKVVNGDGSVRPTPFLDVSSLVSTNSERGLLGLAFHPDYAQNGAFFINYTRLTDGATQVVRYRVSADPNIADPTSATLILSVAQDFQNHNAGDLQFGPDGYLYVPLGDGGSGNDPNNRGQTLNTLLGSLLRIDVDQTAGLPPDCGVNGNYTIPSDNPFVNTAGACDEIWAYGLRNPWRISFDRQTGDLYIADVGQNSREEVNFQPAASNGGEDYGWRCKEGLIDTPSVTPCDPGSDYVPPFFDYERDLGRSITGGYVYRGRTFPNLNGRYFFGDFASGRLWHAQNSGSWAVTDMGEQGVNISSFGQDSAGELYVVGFGGTLYRLIDAHGLDVRGSGPVVSQSGPVEVMLTVENVGSEEVSGVVLRYVVPSGATWASGGTHNSGTVTWNLGSLASGDTTSRTVTLNATQTILHDDFEVTAAELNASVPGQSFKTWVFDPFYRLYLPLIIK